MNRGKQLLSGVLFILLLSSAFSQEGFGQARMMSGVNLGMAGAGAAKPGGISSMYINPSMTAVDMDQRRYGFSLAGFGFSTGGALVNVDAYNRHFTTGQFLGEAEIDHALTDFFGPDDLSMKNGAASIQSMPIGLAYRYDDMYFTLGSRVSSHSKAGFNRGMMELMLTGFDSNYFGNGKPVNTSTQNVTYSDITAGFNRKWLEIENSGWVQSHQLYGGVAVGYVMGHHYAEFDLNSNLTIEGDERIIHEFDYVIQTTGPETQALADYSQELSDNGFTSDFGAHYGDPLDDGITRGSGWHTQLGATWHMDVEPISDGSFFGSGDHHLNISASVTDIGQISFSENSGTYKGSDTVVWEGIEGDLEYIDENYDDFEDYFTTVLEDSILTNQYLAYNLDDDGDHVVGLPTQFNFGSYYRMGRLGVATDLGFGLVERGMNTSNAHFSAGAHYDIVDLIPVRTGVRFGGKTSTSYSAGIGLKTSVFNFEVSVMAVENSGSGGTHLAAGFGGLNFRF